MKKKKKNLSSTREQHEATKKTHLVRAINNKPTIAINPEFDSSAASFSHLSVLYAVPTLCHALSITKLAQQSMIMPNAKNFV